jgi:PLP dependent protein
MGIAENFSLLKQDVPSYVNIVAVTKFQEKEQMVQLYNFGHRVFGENKVQEILRKKDILPSDIQWHMIGHLQTNKVKYVAPFITMIQSVDSLKLLKEINQQAQKSDRIIDCLFQFYIAKEETKFGLDLSEAMEMIENEQFSSFRNIRICGVMGMASFTENADIIRKEFRVLKNIFDTLKIRYFPDNETFQVISMGMTNDYTIAIEEGSNMLRLGSKIFQDS